ncbi:MAG: cyclohydrolase [Pseudomonadota bacterium]
MTIGPTRAELLNRARADLRMGLPVVIEGADGAILAVAVETLGPERLAALGALGGLSLAITARRAETLKVAAYDTDIARLSLPPEGDAGWLRAVADPAADLARPMKGPLRALRGGAGIAATRAAVGLAKSAQLLPAVLLAPAPDALAADLTRVRAEWVGTEQARAPGIAEVAAARLPMRAAGAGRVHVFRPDDGGVEHYAIEVGRPDRDGAPLVRLHSACFTGDVLGSAKCDCGAQLAAALGAMAEAGGGVLLYLNQEGRGIGLANKMRAYALQDQGFDTVEANHRLGFEDDERDFRLGATILRRMGIARVRLMTNNPAKIRMMESQGIEVADRVPLRVGATGENAAYLATKVAKSGHLP